MFLVFAPYQASCARGKLRWPRGSGKAGLGLVEMPTNIRTGFCNDADGFWPLPEGGKLVWYVRHAESEANVAREAAKETDELNGDFVQFNAFRKNETYRDSPLTNKGIRQAKESKEKVATWKIKPSLIVVSPMTRALQTAAIVFEKELLDPKVQLVIRPEIREFFPLLIEDSGRPLPELRESKELRKLKAWPKFKDALSSTRTWNWEKQWNTAWAQGEDGAWEEHCGDGHRLTEFNEWLVDRPQRFVAIVSHYGTINNMLNREPWADGLPRSPIPSGWKPAEGWPAGGIARMFGMPNAGWIAAVLSRIDGRGKPIGPLPTYQKPSGTLPTQKDTPVEQEEDDVEPVAHHRRGHRRRDGHEGKHEEEAESRSSDRHHPPGRRRHRKDEHAAIVWKPSGHEKYEHAAIVKIQAAARARIRQKRRPKKRAPNDQDSPQDESVPKKTAIDGILDLLHDQE